MWYSKLVPYRRECAAVAISASEARSRLFPLIQQVNDDHVPVRINSRSGDVVLMSAEDFDSWQALLAYVGERARDERLGFVMDEFSYYRDSSPELPSVLQRWWDRSRPMAPRLRMRPRP